MFWKKKPHKEINETALRLDGRELQGLFRRYTDENGNSKEDGLGKGGRIDTANGHVILSNGEKEVFVNSDITTVQCGELMSLGGAIFTGYNELTKEVETILVYYTKL